MAAPKSIPYDDREYLKWTSRDPFPGEWNLDKEAGVLRVCLRDGSQHTEYTKRLNHYTIGSGDTYEVFHKFRSIPAFPRCVLQGGPEWVRQFLQGER